MIARAFLYILILINIMFNFLYATIAITLLNLFQENHGGWGYEVRIYNLCQSKKSLPYF